MILSFSDDNFANYMKTIKPFNGLDFPLWKDKVISILKFLQLDYVLNEVTPVPPSSAIEKLDEKMYEYHFKLEKWEKDNKLAKKIIKRLISDCIGGTFRDDDDMDANGLLYVIELSYKSVCVNYLLRIFMTSRHQGQNGLGRHINMMRDVANELKSLGLKIDDLFIEHFIRGSFTDP